MTLQGRFGSNSYEAKSRRWRCFVRHGGDLPIAHADVLLGTIDASPAREVERLLSNLVAGFCGLGSSYKSAGATDRPQPVSSITASLPPHFPSAKPAPNLEYIVVFDVIKSLRRRIDLIVEFGSGKAGYLLDVILQPGFLSGQ